MTAEICRICLFEMQNGLKQAVREIFPPLTHSLHKGQCGRIGIIGGSKEYTGAPYFAGIAALKLGADLIHIICPEAAAPVIKSYSPELIVHPILDKENSKAEIGNWLDRFHSVVIGPGLGRSSEGGDRFRSLLHQLRDRNIPLVLDADALHYVTEDVTLLDGLHRIVLTPNAVEFKRLAAAAGLNEESATVQKLAETLGDVTIVQKGRIDVISDGRETRVVDQVGSPRRCGGQGDILSGALGLFLHWSLLNPNSGKVVETSPVILAAQAAALFTRLASSYAWKLKKRSMTTTDMIEEIQKVVADLENGLWTESTMDQIEAAS